MSKIALFIIDPQNDFMDNGSLPVQGACADMERVATMVQNHGKKINNIMVSLDSHFPIQIFSPAYWWDSHGKHPSPFTTITTDDIKNGTWTPVIPTYRQVAIDYTEALASGGKYQLCIWPLHCIVGSSGSNIYEPLNNELINWQSKYTKKLIAIPKGTSVNTENYSALEAEVPVAGDVTTMLNRPIINLLNDHDTILIAGEAATHCVLCTIKSIVDNFSVDDAKKIVILTDGMSPIVAPGVPSMTEITEDLKKMGVQFSTTVDYFA